MKTLRKGLENGGKKCGTWTSPKTQHKKAVKSGLSFHILFWFYQPDGFSRRQEYTHRSLFPDSQGNDLNYLRRQQEGRNIPGSLSEQLKCPSPSFCLSVKMRFGGGDYRAWFPVLPSSLHMQVYHHHHYSFYKVVWQSGVPGTK